MTDELTPMIRGKFRNSGSRPTNVDLVHDNEPSADLSKPAKNKDKCPCGTYHESACQDWPRCVLI